MMMDDMVFKKIDSIIKTIIVHDNTNFSNLSSFMKILLIRFSSIGDIVLTTPVIRCLKKQVPDCEIHFAVKNSFSAIVEANPYISKVIILSDYVEEVIDIAKRENYDFVVDLHHNLRTLQIKRALKKVRAESFPKLNIQKWLLTNLKINRLPALHIVDRYMKTVESLDVKNDGQGLDYFIPDKEKVNDRDIPAVHLVGYIGLVIGAAHKTKQVPLEKLKAICEKIDHPIMLLGGKEDYQTGKEIEALDPIKIYNACGKFSLHESADLVRRSKFIISNDTGLMHIAAAFKKPVISIWGNTVPAFGMTPYYGNYNIPHAIIEQKNLRCRPCSKIGYAACPKKHFKCMQLLNVEEVIATVHHFLGRKTTA
jgi:ADP-heptose:LPS heptosyltransferase